MAAARTLSLVIPLASPYSSGMGKPSDRNDASHSGPPLPVGKLDPETLERLLARARQTAPPGAHSELVVGPGIGLDAAVLDLRASAGFGEEAEGEAPPFLVAASDPITFAAEEIGWYAVHVNANDVACMGALPRWFMATILLPRGAGEEEAEAIFHQVHRGCQEVGASLIGGHTEVTPGIGRPILMGTMLGVTTRWISAAGARPGDALLLTKGVAIEGTAILAREARDRLTGKVKDAVLERARRFLHDPGISVVPEARVAREAGSVHALHDPTEGGVAGGIHELCEASGTGARIQLDAIPVFPETRELAAPFGIDPLGLIASGALLMATPPEDAEQILRALDDAGIHAVRIGTVEEEDAGVMAVTGGSERPLPRFASDELSRAF